MFDVGLYDPKTKSLDVQKWLKAEAYNEPHDHKHGHGHEHGHGSHDHGHGHGHHHHDVNRHDAHINAVCLTIDEPIERTAFNLWLEMLLEYRGADFLRTKGIVNIAGQQGPIVIHGVQHIFHPAVMLDEWPSDDHRTRIVFITRGIDEEALKDTTKVFDSSLGSRAEEAHSGSQPVQ